MIGSSCSPLLVKNYSTDLFWSSNTSLSINPSFFNFFNTRLIAAGCFASPFKSENLARSISWIFNRISTTYFCPNWHFISSHFDLIFLEIPCEIILSLVFVFRRLSSLLQWCRPFRMLFGSLSEDLVSLGHVVVSSHQSEQKRVIDNISPEVFEQ